MNETYERIAELMLEAGKKKKPLRTTRKYNPRTRKTTKTVTDPNYPKGHPLRTRTSGTYKDTSDLEARQEKGEADYS